MMVVWRLLSRPRDLAREFQASNIERHFCYSLPPWIKRS